VAPRKTYNQSVRSLFPLLLIVALAGCNRDIRNEQAVRQGVIDYLASRSNLNISAMNVEVASVIFRQNEADATVSFSPKGGGPGGSMTMRYTLELKGSKWVVKGRADSGQNPHGSGMPAPGASPMGEMPSGHPTAPPPDRGKK
jgi:hypothetical protein